MYKIRDNTDNKLEECTLLISLKGGNLMCSMLVI